MSLTAALVSAVAPTAINLAANFLTNPRQSSQEKELRRLSKYFKEQSERPYMNTTQGQAQMRMVNEQDDRNRQRATNQGIRSGATGEAELAGTQAVNENTAMATNQVLTQSGDHQQRMLSNYIGTLEGAEQARMNSEQTWQNQIGAIVEGAGIAAGALTTDILRQKYQKTTVRGK